VSWLTWLRSRAQGANVGDAMSPLRQLEVDLGARSYPVIVGNGARHGLASLMPSTARKAAVVTQTGVGVEVSTGLAEEVFLIGGGEEAKNLTTVEGLCRSFARFGLTRSDIVVAVGGGVVSDVAGFAAAVYHRGIAFANVATTLLAQVDAAIGGKVGVNLPEGKNLVGAFWQPLAVVCDTEVLSSLPPREYRSGLGEMAKYAFLGVDSLPELDLDEAVARCVECKARFVAADERESAAQVGPQAAGTTPAAGPVQGRALLNYGHTLGHALETAGHYDLRHGEAVAVGLVFAAHLARRLGRVDDGAVAYHERVVAAYDLPSRLPQGADLAELVRVMRRDKKAVHNGLTFVLDGPAGLEVVNGVDETEVVSAMKELQ